MAGNTDASSTRLSPSRASPHTTTSTGAAATPPCAPESTSASSPGANRPSEWAFAPPSQARRVMAPMAARRSRSRTTMKTQGWRFSALGAKVAASSTFSTKASSTASPEKFRQARWR